MTRLPGIGPTPPEVAAQRARDEHSRFDEPRDAAGRRGARDGSFNAEMRFGQFDLERGLSDDRGAAFLDKVRRALSESGEAASTDGDAGAPRLLAMAGDPQAAASADAAALPAPGRDVPASVRIEALVERIEQSLRGALAPGPGGSLSIRLDLGGAGGFAGISVSMSPDMVDIVLSRAGFPAAEDLAVAAQVLADRLQMRFPRRIVRVFEAPGRDGGGPGGLDEIGALLSRPDVSL